MKYQAIPLHQFVENYHAKYSFDVFLFLEPEHLLLQGGENVWVLFAESKHDIQIMMSIFFEESAAYSPLRMSFGGIIAKENLNYVHIEHFTDFVLAFCKEQRAKNLQITSYPFSYAPSISAICTQIFLQKGFQITKPELTHFLVVGDNFESKLHLSARRRLKKCKKKECVFELWEQPDCRFVYDFVAENRKRKNYPVSMSFEDFQKTLQTFPDQYLVFILKDGQEIIALTVAVVVSSRILYNFYPADKAQYLPYSPMIMLLEGVYYFAQRQGFQILDLGISSDNSLPNYGLIRFKENLGCQTALKFSFSLDLQNR